LTGPIVALHLPSVVKIFAERLRVVGYAADYFGK
jgi:hypothetical protein